MSSSASWVKSSVITRLEGDLLGRATVRNGPLNRRIVEVLETSAYELRVSNPALALQLRKAAMYVRISPEEITSLETLQGMPFFTADVMRIIMDCDKEGAACTTATPTQREHYREKIALSRKTLLPNMFVVELPREGGSTPRVRSSASMLPTSGAIQRSAPRLSPSTTPPAAASSARLVATAPSVSNMPVIPPPVPAPAVASPRVEAAVPAPRVSNLVGEGGAALVLPPLPAATTALPTAGSQRIAPPVPAPAVSKRATSSASVYQEAASQPILSTGLLATAGAQRAASTSPVPPPAVPRRSTSTTSLYEEASSQPILSSAGFATPTSSPRPTSPPRAAVSKTSSPRIIPMQMGAAPPPAVAKLAKPRSPSPKKAKSPTPPPSPKKAKSPTPPPSPKKAKSPTPPPSPKKTSFDTFDSMEDEEVEALLAATTGRQTPPSSPRRKACGVVQTELKDVKTTGTDKTARRLSSSAGKVREADKPTVSSLKDIGEALENALAPLDATVYDYARITGETSRQMLVIFSTEGHPSEKIETRRRAIAEAVARTLKGSAINDRSREVVHRPEGGEIDYHIAILSDLEGIPTVVKYFVSSQLAKRIEKGIAKQNMTVSQENILSSADGTVLRFKTVGCLLAQLNLKETKTLYGTNVVRL